MNIVIVKDYYELSMQAAQIVSAQINKMKKSVLGLPTGQTPLGMYGELIKKFEKDKIDFSQVITFNLDEYYGLSPLHPQSYHYFMWNTFFQHINIKKENVNMLNGIAENIDEECQRYENSIQIRGGIDLQLLGIGENAHIGFNEPADVLKSRTHLVNLSDSTVKANSRFFNDINEVPRQALTMGMGTIMKAKKIVLLVSGKKKASALAKTVSGLVSTKVPASLLQLHKEVTILVDEEAASQI